MKNNMELTRFQDEISYKMKNSNHKRPLRKIQTVGIILISILKGIFISSSFCQWDNPSERYSNVYKKYSEASCPVPADKIKHYVYFARDRDAIRNHPFLEVSRFEGAQIMYSWNQLEPGKGEYDFTVIQEDYEYLLSQGKKLFIQLQDATFNPAYKAVPSYLLNEEYGVGAVIQHNDKGEPEGWVARRWNEKVQERFANLLEALGKEFDGLIEGINLQETAIGVRNETDSTFTPERYVKSIETNMLALKKAFPVSATMQYANFMPGEWLPWEDRGFLRSVYQYGKEIGVGLGAPDLMIRRKGQLNHALAMMHEGEYSVPLGIAVQDGNYVGKTGADQDYNESEDSFSKGHKNIVPELHAFAEDFLRVDYMFWVKQEPYFSEDVIPCFEAE